MKTFNDVLNEVLNERELKSSERLDQSYKIPKTLENYAKKKGIGVEYDTRKESKRDEEDNHFHLISIYLDVDDETDSSIIYKVNQYKNYDFYGTFYAVHYDDETNKKIKALLPKEIHGEKELKTVIDKLYKIKE